MSLHVCGVRAEDTELPRTGRDFRERLVDDCVQRVAGEHGVEAVAPWGVCRVGWGHSKVDDAVTFALSAGARHLVLFHHDPLHGDSELEALLVSAAHRWGDAGTPPALAREGLMFELH